MKIKVLLLASVILAVLAAFADVDYQKQDHLWYFYWNGVSFQPIWGEAGRDYVCIYFPPEVCTYYYDFFEELYVPYESGQYYEVFH